MEGGRRERQIERLRDRESLTTIAIEYTSISRFGIEGIVIIGRLSHRS